MNSKKCKHLMLLLTAFIWVLLLSHRVWGWIMSVHLPLTLSEILSVLLFCCFLFHYLTKSTDNPQQPSTLPTVMRPPATDIASTSSSSVSDKKTLIIGGIVCGILLAIASSFQQVGIVYTTVARPDYHRHVYRDCPDPRPFVGKKVRLIAWISVGLSVIGPYLLCMTEVFPWAKVIFLSLSALFVFRFIL